MTTTTPPLPPRVAAAQRFQHRFSGVLIGAHFLSYAPLMLLSVHESLAIGLCLLAMLLALGGPLMIWGHHLKRATQITEAWKVASQDQLVQELRHEARAEQLKASLPPPLRLRT